MNGIIKSTNFLDTGNRFILIMQGSTPYAYDIQLNILSQFNATLQDDSILVDQSSSQMIVTLNNVRYVTNIAISSSSGNSSLNQTAAQVNSSSNASLTNTTTNIANTTWNNTVNTTSNATNSNTTNTDNQQNVSTSFIYLLNLT